MNIILQYTGTIEIEPGLILENPKMEVVSVLDYNISTNIFKIEVHFWEVLYRFSRTYETTNPGLNSLSLSQVFDFVESHPLLSQFEIVV